MKETVEPAQEQDAAPGPAPADETTPAYETAPSYAPAPSGDTQTQPAEEEAATRSTEIPAPQPQD